MIIKRIVVGMIETNCYILLDEQTGKAAVIDPGFMSQGLKKAIQSPEIKSVDYILLTHGHFDHIMGVYELKEMTGAKVAIHKNEKNCLESERYSLASQVMPGKQKGVKCDVELDDGMVINVGSLEVKVIFTPGHTTGGCCFLVGDTLFAGDTIFAGSIGRCDLPGGDYRTLLNSINMLSKNLVGDYRVLSGHGEETTLDVERKYNPYFRG